MESTIKWKTGEPKENGLYIVTVENEKKERGVTLLNWNIEFGKFLYFDSFPRVIAVAWCKLSDIEPYKKE